MGSIDELRRDVDSCRNCDLYRDAIQAVVSEGAVDAAVVMVGETPGDIEDRKGRPFVGPGGGLLRRAMAEVGIAPEDTYLTNAVKHFKFHREAGSQRRIHDKPNRAEIVACRPWLVAEFELLRPRLVVALGATAAQSMVGSSFRVTRSRGEVMDWPGVAQHPEDFPELDPPAKFVATVHPAAVLRAEDTDAAYEQFVGDLSAGMSAVDARRRRSPAAASARR